MPNTFSIAFYNLENLFDFEHNSYTLDEDYTPEGEYLWNHDRYLRKIQNLSNVISKIGLDQSKLPPIFIGVSEVENKTCLEDLINSDKLKPFDYDYVHYDSPDERGIDVAFLYQKKFFSLNYSDTFTLYLTDNENNRDYTRDILLLSGKLFNEQIYIIINHWPSRTNGTKTSENKRVKAAKLVQKILDDIYKENNNAKIIIMGDFNDDPNSNSIKNHLMNSDLYNPMLELQEQNKGSVKYHGKWYLFDQIILNKSLLDNKKSKIRFKYAEIFDASFIKEKSNKRKGAPKRTFIGKWHQGGFSDHFPVLVYFDTENSVKL
jgi:predicted extracellular nuclease